MRRVTTMPRTLLASPVLLLIALAEIISLATITSLWVVHPQVAQAATFTVTNTSGSSTPASSYSSGPGSLSHRLRPIPVLVLLLGVKRNFSGIDLW